MKLMSWLLKETHLGDCIICISIHTFIFALKTSLECSYKLAAFPHFKLSLSESEKLGSYSFNIL